MYCEGAAEAAHPEPDRGTWRVSRSIYVGESNDEAREFCLGGAFARALLYLRDIGNDLRKHYLELDSVSQKSASHL